MYLTLDIGKESHDIDIALDDMAGIDFANLVNEYLTIKGMHTRTIAVIQVSYPAPTMEVVDD